MIISHILTLYPHSYGLNFEPSSFDGCIMSYPSHVGYPPKQPSTSSSLPRDRGKRFHSPLWARCPPKDLPVGSAWVGRTPGVEPTFYLWEKRNKQTCEYKTMQYAHQLMNLSNSACKTSKRKMIPEISGNPHGKESLNPPLGSYSDPSVSAWSSPSTWRNSPSHG